MTQEFPYTTVTNTQKFFTSIAPAGFGAETFPTEAVLEYYIPLAAANVDHVLREAGYIVPLVAIDGEDWPTSQSYFLEYVVGMAVGGMVGAALAPLPLTEAGDRSVSGNFFQQQYNRWERAVRGGSVGLRAQFNRGTMAEVFLESPQGPRWSDDDYTLSEVEDVLGFWNASFSEEINLTNRAGYYPERTTWR